MKFNSIVICFSVSLFYSITAFTQQEYQYSVNLNKLEKDALQVELRTPAVKQATAVFSIPKIIPGSNTLEKTKQDVDQRRDQRERRHKQK